MRSEIQEHGLYITGYSEIQKQVWITCPSPFLFYATHTKRVGKIFQTGVLFVYCVDIKDDFSFDYALSAIEADIEYWSEPKRYRHLIDGLVMPDPTLMACRGQWN